MTDAHLGTQSGMTEPASMRDILVGLYIGWERGKVCENERKSREKVLKIGDFITKRREMRAFMTNGNETKFRLPFQDILRDRYPS